MRRETLFIENLGSILSILISIQEWINKNSNLSPKEGNDFLFRIITWIIMLGAFIPSIDIGIKLVNLFNHLELNPIISFVFGLSIPAAVFYPLILMYREDKAVNYG